MANPPTVVGAVGFPDYVFVLREEWERMLEQDMVREGVKSLKDPETKWIDTDDAVKMFARDKIVQARKAKGLTQQQLGKLVKMPQSQVSRLESNPEATTIRTLKRVAKALGVNVAELLG